MKKIFKLLIVAAAALFAFAACETYKLPETEYTKIAWLDGRYICFGIDDSVAPPDTTVLEVEITNTSSNAADSAWVTIMDYSIAQSTATVTRMYPAYAAYVPAYWATYGYVYFPAAYRFKIACNASDKSFAVDSSVGENPEFVYNETLGQAYYSAGSYFEVYETYDVAVANGALEAGVASATGYKTDAIGFDLDIKDPATSASILKCKVSGIKKTGWAGDVAEYAGWVGRQ